MKTVIELTRGRVVIVAPSIDGGGLDMSMAVGGFSVFASLTPDEAGAVLFAIEQALEARKTRADGLAAVRSGEVGRCVDPDRCYDTCLNPGACGLMSAKVLALVSGAPA